MTWTCPNCDKIWPDRAAAVGTSTGEKCIDCDRDRSPHSMTDETKTRVGMWLRDECDVYAGRGRNGKRFGSAEIGERGWLGNPYRVDEYGREESIEKFRQGFERRLETDDEFRRAIANLSGLVLGCWCQRLADDSPACHAEIIAHHADALAGGDA